MPTGNRRTRIAHGFALSLGVVLVAGCLGPACRVDPGATARPAPTQAASATPARPAPEPPVDFAAMPPLPPTQPVPRPRAPEPTPTPTPILDAALKQARAMEESVIEETARPVAEAVPAPAAAPAPAPAQPDAKVKAPVAKVDATPSASASASADAWGDSLERLRRLAREKAATPGEAAGDWEVRERILGGLAGTDVTGQGGNVRSAVLTALGQPEPVETEEQPAQGAATRPNQAGAAEGPPLEITELRACRRVSGFGDIEPWVGSAIRAGQALILYCEMAGIRYEAEGDLFRSRLAARIELIAEGSETPTWEETLGTAEDACRRRRHDYYVNYRINLPATLAPGAYQLRLTQADKVAGRSTSRAIPLVVGP